MEGNKGPIYDDIKLFITAEKFYLEPAVNPTEILVIDRVTSQASVTEPNKVKINIPSYGYRPICGFLGTIELLSGYYLVVATYRTLVGKIEGQDVYQMSGTDLIPFARSETHLTQQQIEDNGTYVRMIKSVLETPGIYFSYSYDLTHTLQRLANVGPEFQQMSLLSRADARFVWNTHLLKDFTAEAYGRFALPLVEGFVTINRALINGQYFTWILVSRRNIHRAGTRLFARGIDTHGAVANFVETEQIVERNGDRASYVQTRGSIPLFWHQLPNLKYKPLMRVIDEDHVSACQRHLAEQVDLYGNQMLVNLIDHSGREKCLEMAFRAVVAAVNSPNVTLESFDFHSECKKMRYDRLDNLLNRIQPQQLEFSYFLSRNGVVKSRQTGVFRTNCVDCLDRTNVVQSLLARRQLERVLRLLGVLGVEAIENHDPFESLFKNVWADHADMISMQYSGTGALKTDFTRTGKRTRKGLIQDGLNSLTRYYKNNFCDGFRQDSIDLFMGRANVSQSGTAGGPNRSLLRGQRDWKHLTFPSVLLVAASMFCASAILPSEYSSEVLLYLMFWGGMLGATLTYILRHGREFTDYPRLGSFTLPVERDQAGTSSAAQF